MFNKGNVILNMKNQHGSRLSRTYIHMAHTYIYLILLYARTINISHDLSERQWLAGSLAYVLSMAAT